MILWLWLKLKVAVQLYTIRDKVSDDYVNALKIVSRIGYKGVEFTEQLFGEVPADKLRRLLNDLKITPVSVHVNFRNLINKLDDVIGEAVKLGLKYIVSEPSVREISSLNDSLRIAKIMNEIGERIKEAGMLLGMHNHAAEFESRIGDKTVYDLLVENTDPSLVFFQPDVYWIMYAGYDPVDVIRNLKGRCHLIHIKDMKNLGTKEFAELGRGIIDFKAIIETGDEAGADWYIVENDRPSVDSFESIRMALEYLRENFAVE